MENRQDILNNIMKNFFTIQLINKLYHFNTTLFRRHKISDDFDKVIQEYLDKFCEVYIGKYKVKPYINSIKPGIEYMNDDQIENIYIQFTKYLEQFESLINDTDLLAIRDELLSEVNKLLYLLRLN